MSVRNIAFISPEYFNENYLKQNNAFSEYHSLITDAQP